MTDAQPPAKYKVGLVQMAMSADPDENLKHAIDRVEEAARQGARLVCLPELFRSRYFAQVEDAALFDLAEPVPGPSTEALGKVARRAGVVVIAPVFERRAPGLYHNTAAVIDADGRLVGLYRKMHIPDDPAYYEKFYFAPGDLGFRTFDTQVGRIGTLVCWDQWYPEGARLTALQGAHILLYPTAIGWHPRERQQHGAQQLDAWRTIQRSHAIANGLFVAAVNRVGHERPAEGGGDRADGIEFWGSSFLADPFGVVVMEAPRDREAVLVAEVDLARIEEVRRSWPFLRDRRIDAYAGIGERFLDNAPPLIADSGWLTAPHRPHSASLCPPSGSRTRPPGSAGRTTRATGRGSSPRSNGCTGRSCASLPQARRCGSSCSRESTSAKRAAYWSGPAWTELAWSSCGSRRTAGGRATSGPCSCDVSGPLRRSRSCGSASMPGPNTPTGRKTIRSPSASRAGASCGCSQRSPPAATWSSRVGAST